jgi:predicted DsbA family dithiol-disulfide isomerase
MKVEIWSDVMCPFCYIGKRHFEKAMEALPFQDEIEVEWKSFQLNPDYENVDHEDLYAYLARSKGMSRQQAQQMTLQVADMAKNAGLSIDFSTNIPANSFNAHRLIHFAADKGLQDQAEEALFKAHFVEAKDVANQEELLSIAKELGLEVEAVKKMLDSDEFAEAVRYDVYESQQLGIRGVPYFVLDRKYGISGAQPVETFVEAITKGYKEWKESKKTGPLEDLGTAGKNACDDTGCEI